MPQLLIQISFSLQVEFEGSKHEIRHLQEEVDLMTQQVEELSNLKKIAEKQLEESLEALQNEREQRHILKKEMDAKMNSESMFQLGNLALSIQGADGGVEGDSEATAAPSAAEDSEGNTEMFQDENGAGADESGPTSDLFTEIHGGEFRKLEKKIETAENEKIQLAKLMAETKSQLDRTKEEVTSYQAAIAQLESHLAAIEHLKTSSSSEDYESTATVVDREVSAMRGRLAELEKSAKAGDAVQKLKSELTSLRKDLAGAEQKNVELNHDLRIFEKLATDSLRSLGDTHTDVSAVQSELAHIYEQVCKANHQTPSKLAMMQGEGAAKTPSPKRHLSTTEVMVTKLRGRNHHVAEDLGKICHPGLVKSGVESVKDQIKYLKDAVEKYIETSRNRGSGNGVKTSSGAVVTDEAVAAELAENQEHIIKLKSLLSTKREQIATLRTVLKANKQTAEAALSNLKSMYDNEKMVVRSTMTKLRNELRLLKEDAATFSSLRSMFAARCEEYSTQVDELQGHLSGSEEEKRTLNQLLRMAIQQKLVLTQRLEEHEMASAIQHTPKRHARGPRGALGGGGGGAGGGGGGMSSSRGASGFSRGSGRSGGAFLSR
jgi:protein bicaudal D